MTGYPGSFYFNPLRREGGDIKSAASRLRPYNFNPLRREGGDNDFDSLRFGWINFNPLRREGGDLPIVPYDQSIVISIHSAARAETMYSSP